MNEVLNTINRLNLHKSVGPDNIEPYFLRMAGSILASIVCNFIDNAFRLGIFPKNCKMAKIVPLYKSGNTENLTNYKPIFILICFSKIFEKLIYKRLISFFQKHMAES